MAMKPNFKKDILALSEKLQDESYARAFYAALCNVQWLHFSETPEGANGCTWRYAGGIVAEMRGCGEDYMDFYCSGNEGRVREDVYKDMKALGYKPIPYDLEPIEIYNNSTEKTTPDSGH